MSLRARLLLLAATLALPLSAHAMPKSRSAGNAAARPAAKAIDWTARVTLSPTGGHILGNPAAPTKIVDYVSYTCPHCGHFVAEGTAPLKADYIRTGKVSAEARNAVRDRYDLTAALLARCGGPARFYGNHEALFANQEAWFPQLETYNNAHQDVVPENKRVALYQDIARSTGLYALMGKRGFTPKQLDACLADTASLAKILAMTKDAYSTVKIRGTPGFTVNGKLVDGATWNDLKAALPTP